MNDREALTEALIRELVAERDYWLRRAKTLEIAHDRLADKVEAVKKAVAG